MLNEYTYCPRLFHLEWVQGQFVDNPDTAEGTWQHRAIDVEKGRMPVADAVDELREARSVMVGSERLLPGSMSSKLPMAQCVRLT